MAHSRRLASLKLLRACQASSALASSAFTATTLRFSLRILALSPVLRFSSDVSDAPAPSAQVALASADCFFARLRKTCRDSVNWGRIFGSGA
eukprot:m.202743 g.202743  ORF g.202743 m.202743 type:complete len:92 (+) comp10109_c2_seq12:180-455(+)